MEERSPQERDTEIGDLLGPPSRGEGSWDSNENMVGSGSGLGSGSDCSTGRVGSPLQDLDMVANLIRVVKRKHKRSKQQAQETQDELMHLKGENDKNKVDLDLLQDKYATEKESLVLVQGELIAEKGNLLRVYGELAVEKENLIQVQAELTAGKKNLVRVQGKLATEKEQSVRIQGELAAHKERLICLQNELAIEKDHCEVAENRISTLRTEIRDLKAELHEAKVKIDAQTEKTLCQICMEHPRNAVCLPCMHSAFCIPCIEQHQRTSKTCPICRISTKGVLECYGLA